MKYIQFIEAHDFTNTPVKLSYDSFLIKDTLYHQIGIVGEFSSAEQEYRYFTIKLCRIQTDEMPAAFRNSENAVLRSISVTKDENVNHVTLTIAIGEETYQSTFLCEYFYVYGNHYLGFDETNVYGTPEYDAYRERFFYAERDAYFDGEKIIELPDGYSFVKKSYIHQTERAVKAYLERCRFCKNGKCLYEYVSIDGHHGVYKEFIHHRNGHRYYPFHMDLYGISYLDVDTLELFHYVPRGYDNDYGAPCGESFIITDIHYDPQSNLIAYGGCFWAGPSEVMVGDFSDPLHFDPHFVRVCDLIEFEDDDDDEIDFGAWETEGLRIRCSRPECSFFSKEMLLRKIHGQT